jgi:threonine dehydrogenase-like Zn-dependent dehydrogenase
MSDTTEIEKKSLEAHVELCAQRYKFIEEKLENMEAKIVSVADTVTTVKNCIEKMSNKNNDRLLAWGVGIIGFLTAVIGYLLVTYVFK